jgi:hypothetical protein
MKMRYQVFIAAGVVSLMAGPVSAKPFTGVVVHDLVVPLERSSGSDVPEHITAVVRIDQETGRIEFCPNSESCFEVSGPLGTDSLGAGYYQVMPSLFIPSTPDGKKLEGTLCTTSTGCDASVIYSSRIAPIDFINSENGEVIEVSCTLRKRIFARHASERWSCMWERLASRHKSMNSPQR